MFAKTCRLIFLLMMIPTLSGCDSGSNQKIANDDEVAAFIEENKQSMSNQETMEDALGGSAYASPQEMERGAKP